MMTIKLLRIVYIFCLLVFVLPAISWSETAEKFIASSGKSIATIVIPAEATPVEKSAAKELKSHLEKVTGARFKIVAETTSKNGPRLIVGNTAVTRELVPDFDPKTAAYDSIVLKTVRDDLILTGHPRRGPLYAVYTFLEDTVGVRWWTSEETFIPRKPILPVPVLNIRYAPKLRFRESYYLDSFNALFKTRLKGNFCSRTRYMLAPMEMIPEAYGGNHRLIHFKGRNSAFHSFHELLPPAKYFNEHPEWYSEIKGKRTYDKAQLCLTNEEMRKELVRNALILLREDPGADMIQISQNDHHGRCECKDCLAVEIEEGGIGTASGPLLRFVNRVAEDLEKEFPDVFVDTFAYTYTRKAPAKIKPRHNVLIRLCDIECSFLQPLEGSKENASFVHDLEEWSKIAGGNVFAWDYVTDFTSYMLPHPNLRVLAPNIRFFVKNGATGLFEQGDALCSAGDFVRLRHWLISHLLWNPDLDENRLIDDFLTGYYGEKTGMALKRYLTFIHDRAEASGVYLGCYQQNVTRWLAADEIVEATRLMNTALKTAQEEEARDPKGNKGLTDKIIREKLSLDHVWLLNYFPLRRQAALTGQPFIGPPDLLEACRTWISTCDRFKVKAYCETNKKETFKDYKKSLLEQCQHVSEPASVPDICKNLPGEAWMDWQEFEFDRRSPKQVSVVRDETASNKYAVRMLGDHNIWAVQFPLIRFPATNGTPDQSPQTCRVCAFVRCEAPVKSGTAMTLGVWDFNGKKMVVTRTVPVSDVDGNSYHLIDLGRVEIRKGCSFWASPPKRPGEVKAVFVDRVVVIKE
ncbi:MAG: DUF4838 domain-containing protein [Kiritimatiellae bacterium]|nr:DUF4838 domain-containing protein [Kiritimatiellia bacterium]MDD5523114.1 DUF4838 domain-containing protein [Kiritimatiellia bacterium]